MSRTLTVGAIAAKNSNQQVYDVLLVSEDLGIYYSTGYDGDPSPGTWEFRFQEDAFSEIVQQVPPGGGISATMSLSVRVIEDGVGNSPRNLINTFGQLEGSDLSLSILFDGEAYADRIELFPHGIIDQVRFVGRHAEIIAVDHFYHRDLLYPLKVLPQDNPNAPASAIPRAIPTVYGAGSVVGLAPMLLINPDERTYIVANHEMGTLAIGDARTAIFSSDSNTSVVQAHDGDAAGDFEAATLTLLRPLSELLFGPGDATLSIQREQSAAQPEHAIDGNPLTAVVLSPVANLDTFGDGQAYLGIRGEWVSPEGSDRMLINIIAHSHDTNSDSATFTEVSLRIIDGAGAILHNNLWRQLFQHKGTGRPFQIEVPGISLLADQFAEVFFETIHSGGLGGGLDLYYLWDVEMELGVYPRGTETPLFLFEEWRGRPDDAAGTLTGTPRDTLRIPTDVVYTILVSDLGEDTCCLSTLSDSRTLLADWRFDGGIGAGWFQEREGLTSFLDRLMKQCGSYLYWRGPGWAFKAYNKEATSQLAITISDVAWQRGTTVETPIQQRGPSWEMYNTSVRDVANRFEIRYAYNAGSGTFDKFRYCNTGGTNHATEAEDLVNLCVSSVDRFGELAPFTLDADFVYEDETADRLLSHVVQYFWSQRLYTEFDIKDWRGIHLEPTDFIDITYADLPTVFNGGLYEIHAIRTDVLRARQHVVCSTLSLTTFNFFIIFDQDAVPWYWFISTGDNPDWRNALPAFLGFSPIEVTITPIPSWLEIEANSTTYYVHPSLDGAPIVATSAPPNGTGYIGSPTLRARSGNQWQYTVTEGEHLDLVEA